MGIAGKRAELLNTSRNSARLKIVRRASFREVDIDASSTWGSPLSSAIEAFCWLIEVFSSSPRFDFGRKKASERSFLSSLPV